MMDGWKWWTRAGIRSQSTHGNVPRVILKSSAAAFWWEKWIHWASVDHSIHTCCWHWLILSFRYEVVLDSDAEQYNGHKHIDPAVQYTTVAEPWDSRQNHMLVCTLYAHSLYSYIFPVILRIIWFCLVMHFIVQHKLFYVPELTGDN